MINIEIINYLSSVLLIFIICHVSFYYTGRYTSKILLNSECDFDYASNILIGFSIFAVTSFFAYILKINTIIFLVITSFIIIFSFLKSNFNFSFSNEKIKFLLISFLIILSLINIFPFSINLFENNYSSDFWSYLANATMLSKNHIIEIRIPQFKENLNFSLNPLNPFILYVGLVDKILDINILYIWRAFNIYNIFLFIILLTTLCRKIFNQKKLLILLFFTIYLSLIYINDGFLGISKDIFRHFNYPRHLTYICLLLLNILFLDFYGEQKKLKYLIILIIFFTISVHPQSIILISINFFIWFTINFKIKSNNIIKDDLIIFVAIIFFSILWYLLVKKYIIQTYFDHLSIDLVENYHEYLKVYGNYYIFNIFNIFDNKINIFLFFCLYSLFFWYIKQKKNNERNFIIFAFFQINLIFLILFNPIILNLFWKFIPPFATTRLIYNLYLPELISIIIVYVLNQKINPKKLQYFENFFFNKLNNKIPMLFFIFILILIFFLKNNQNTRNQNYFDLINFIEKDIPTNSILISDENTSVQFNTFNFINIVNSREHYLKVYENEFYENKKIFESVFMEKKFDILKDHFVKGEYRFFILINKNIYNVDYNNFNSKNFELKTALDNYSYKVIEILYSE